MGVVTGIATMTGHRATGIEINADLVAAARELLSEFELECQIIHGDYFELLVEADYYFVYCWPGQRNRVEEHFRTSTPDHAQLIICDGAEVIRVKNKSDV